MLVALLLPIVGKAREASRQASCLSNLRQIGLGFRLYDQGNDALPYPAFSSIPWERSLSVYVGTNVFQCPADSELAPATGSSYDWRDTGIPETTLAGRSLREVTRPSVILAFDALPDWHQKGMINVVTVDGASRSIPYPDCAADLEAPVGGAAGAQAAIVTAAAKRAGGGRKR